MRAVGITVSAIARTDLEPGPGNHATAYLELNDESGGIGWGAPEAMGEITAENEILAREYHPILVSYIDEKGNPLENHLLERGVMWGIGRLAQKSPELLREVDRSGAFTVEIPRPGKKGPGAPNAAIPCPLFGKPA